MARRYRRARSRSEHRPLAHGSGDYDLFQTIRNAPRRQMPSLAALPADDVWRIVTYIKSLSGRSNATEVASGNAAAGRRCSFGAGRCVSCHEVNGKGAAMPPTCGLSSKSLGAIQRRGA